MSQASSVPHPAIGNGRAVLNASPYDPISPGSSRRSSIVETNGNHQSLANSTQTLAPTISEHFERLHRRRTMGLVGNSVNNSTSSMGTVTNYPNMVVTSQSVALSNDVQFENQMMNASMSISRPVNVSQDGRRSSDPCSNRPLQPQNQNCIPRYSNPNGSVVQPSQNGPNGLDGIDDLLIPDDMVNYLTHHPSSPMHQTPAPPYCSPVHHHNHNGTNHNQPSNNNENGYPQHQQPQYSQQQAYNGNFYNCNNSHYSPPTPSYHNNTHMPGQGQQQQYNAYQNPNHNTVPSPSNQNGYSSQPNGYPAQQYRNNPHPQQQQHYNNGANGSSYRPVQQGPNNQSYSPLCSHGHPNCHQRQGPMQRQSNWGQSQQQWQPQQPQQQHGPHPPIQQQQHWQQQQHYTSAMSHCSNTTYQSNVMTNVMTPSPPHYPRNGNPDGCKSCYSNSPRTPTEVQCKNVTSQSQKLTQAHLKLQNQQSNHGVPSTPDQYPHSGNPNNNVFLTNPPGMRPEAYQRTLKFVEDCEAQLARSQMDGNPLSPDSTTDRNQGPSGPSSVHNNNTWFN